MFKQGVLLFDNKRQSGSPSLSGLDGSEANGSSGESNRNNNVNNQVHMLSQRTFSAEEGQHLFTCTSTSSKNVIHNNINDIKAANSNISMSVLNGILHGVISVILSLNFPFLLAYRDATEIYHT